MHKTSSPYFGFFGKIFVCLTALALIVPAELTVSIAQEPLPEGVFRRNVVITGYYSPLPDQPFYITGSYEGDIRLNGRGTNGASGKEVYPGMIAAPKDYPFGTRISIPGIGLGTVHDRGGAIVSNYKDKAFCQDGNCDRVDRIDVWCGKGMEGLARALYWIGVKRATATVYPPGMLQVADSLPLPYIDPTPLVQRGMKAAQKSPTNNAAASAAPTATDLKSVQKSLQELGLYAGEIDGKNNEALKQAVFVFQQHMKLVSSPTDSAAGFAGPQTRTELQRAVQEFHTKINHAVPTAGLGKGSAGEAVIKVQDALRQLGYYMAPSTGKYDAKTIDAVYRFQLEHKLIVSGQDAGAGYFGAKTRDTLKSIITGQEKQLFAQNIGKKSLQLTQTNNDDEPPHMDIFQIETFLQSTLSYQDSGENVRKLQEYLQMLGYLKDQPTGYFGEKTLEAVMEFQKDYSIITASGQKGAGVFGPATRTQFASLVHTIQSPRPEKKVEASTIVGTARRSSQPQQDDIGIRAI